MGNTPQKAVPAKATQSAPPVGQQVAESTENARPRLTDDMPQPPGVRERRSRRVKRERRKGPFVKYVGAAAQRDISPSQWGSLGFKDVPKNGFAHSSWNMRNDYMIESENFTDEQLDYLLIDDLQGSGAHSFLEMDWDEDGQLVQVVEEDEEDE